MGCTSFPNLPKFSFVPRRFSLGQEKTSGSCLTAKDREDLKTKVASLISRIPTTEVFKHCAREQGILRPGQKTNAEFRITEDQVVVITQKGTQYSITSSKASTLSEKARQDFIALTQKITDLGKEVWQTHSTPKPSQSPVPRLSPKNTPKTEDTRSNPDRRLALFATAAALGRAALSPYFNNGASSAGQTPLTVTTLEKNLQRGTVGNNTELPTDRVAEAIDTIQVTEADFIKFIQRSNIGALFPRKAEPTNIKTLKAHVENLYEKRVHRHLKITFIPERIHHKMPTQTPLFPFAIASQSLNTNHTLLPTTTPTSLTQTPLFPFAIAPPAFNTNHALLPTTTPTSLTQHLDGVSTANTALPVIPTLLAAYSLFRGIFPTRWQSFLDRTAQAATGGTPVAWQLSMAAAPAPSSTNPKSLTDGSKALAHYRNSSFSLFEPAANSSQLPESGESNAKTNSSHPLKNGESNPVADGLATLEEQVRKSCSNIGKDGRKSNSCQRRKNLLERFKAAVEYKKYPFKSPVPGLKTMVSTPQPKTKQLPESGESNAKTNSSQLPESGGRGNGRAGHPIIGPTPLAELDYKSNHCKRLQKRLRRESPESPGVLRQLNLGRNRDCLVVFDLRGNCPKGRDWSHPRDDSGHVNQRVKTRDYMRLFKQGICKKNGGMES